MAGRLRTLLVGFLIAATLCGCHAWSTVPGAAPGGFPLLPNPLPVPVVDREVLWNQLIDTVDSYFKIQREERVRQVGEVLVEGRIETYPLDGATLLEPWRKDSTPGYEKLHSTLQSVRRRAVVRVLPTDSGFLIDVAVYKELENVGRPQRDLGSHGAIHQEPAPNPSQERFQGGQVSLGWIPTGRDVTLEQQILAEIRSRLSA